MRSGKSRSVSPQDDRLRHSSQINGNRFAFYGDEAFIPERHPPPCLFLFMGLPDETVENVSNFEPPLKRGTFNLLVFEVPVDMKVAIPTGGGLDISRKCGRGKGFFGMGGPWQGYLGRIIHNVIMEFVEMIVLRESNTVSLL